MFAGRGNAGEAPGLINKQLDNNEASGNDEINEESEYYATTELLSILTSFYYVNHKLIPVHLKTRLMAHTCIIDAYLRENILSSPEITYVCNARVLSLQCKGLI
jgi:hypothetical protein